MVLASLLLPAHPAAQQAPTPLELEEQLRSTSIAEVSWAAFQAGAFGVTETVPTLVTALESPPVGNPQQRDYLAAAILDALAQMPFWPGGAGVTPVSPTIVAAQFDRWPLQTLVVLGRIGPVADTVTLELLRTLPARQSLRTGNTWFALANLLVPRSPIGFASLLLSDITFDLRVTVRDLGEGFGLSGGSGEGGVFDSITQKPAGFPPHAEYQWDTARVGSLLMSSGPRTLYYRRVLNWRDQFGVAFPFGRTPTNDDRLEYLAAVAQRSDPPRLRQHTALYLTWKDRDTFTTEIREEQRRIANLYELILRELVTAGRLTKSEADALPLRLTTTVEDARTKRTPPLPPSP